MLFDILCRRYDMLITSLLKLFNRLHGGIKSGSYLYFKLSDSNKNKKTNFYRISLLLFIYEKNIVFKFLYKI